MNRPLPSASDASARRPDDAHRGLWFDRFFDRYDHDWQVSKPNKRTGQDPKRDWIDTVTGRCGDAKLLRSHALRRMHLVEAIGGQSRCYATDWHFATGLGLSHPVENGLLWHPTLGVPYLNGAAVKGLMRAFAEVWQDPPASPEQRQSWFGSQQHGDIPEQAGDYIYFDALPLTRPELATDVMTPHMGKWYQQGHSNQVLAATVCPGDWHDPVPIPFLVVKQASFQFTIVPRQAHTDPADLDALFDLLDQTLAWIGAGAKTAVGYGVMIRDTDTETSIKEQQRRAAMSPVEHKLQAWIDENRSDNPPIALLQQLESGAWDDQPELRQAAAERIRELWQVDKKWTPDFPGTNKKKIQQRDRCRKVQGYLQ